MRLVPSLLLLGCLLETACAPPKAPEDDRRPQPQVARDDAPTSAIVRSADAYKDRARDAEASQLEAADQQRAEIDAQTQ